ncbi:hypothetical protein LCGC14_1334660 [marine sediment metagenome]|uniref:Uncharacterized protein n=1 Tax=marine sediment metagenome TaxID=412755 RepID=A0A0F9KG90_9ZZZZ
MTKQKLNDLLQKHGSLEWNGKCHDCGDPVNIQAIIEGENHINISGGAVYEVDQMVGCKLYLKCDVCFGKNKELRNFQSCEVYSRVVGYLRPVSQWNEAKQVEYGDRKTFDKNMKGIN